METSHQEARGVEHVETLWYCLFLDQESIIEFAEMFSAQQNIVESDDWLNLIVENGKDNGCAMERPDISERLKGAGNPNFGKRGKGTTSYGHRWTKTKEQTQYLRDRVGEKNPIFGTKWAMNDEGKKKIAEYRKGKVVVYDTLDSTLKTVEKDLWESDKTRFVHTSTNRYRKEYRHLLS